MSKEKNKKEEETPSTLTYMVIKNGTEYHIGQVITSRDFDMIEGNIMSIIECIGMPSKQEESVKSQVRQAIYRPLKHATQISAQEHADLN